MVRKMLFAALAGGMLWLLSSSSAPAADLFYNYYVGSPAAVPAQLYVAPRPTPAFTGQTYITYQPLLPHEFMYHHHRSYYKYYPHGGYTKTYVKWW